MKKIIILFVAIVFAKASQAQFETSNLYASISGNYTMYRGDFRQKTPGVKLDIGYSISEKIRASLGYTYHLTIKTPSEITATDGIGTKTLASEFVYNFSTVSLMCNYTFGESEDNPVSVYTPVGISYVMVKYKEQLKESVPAGYSSSDQMAPGKESGFVMNFGIGAQYNFGTARAFIDGSLALPATTVNNQYVENVIPGHLVFNVGIRIPFGERSSD